MDRKQQSVVLAGLLALALTGCSSMRGGSSSGDDLGAAPSASMGSGTTGATAAASGVDSASGSMAAPPQSTGAAGSATMPGGLPNAVVVSIEVVPRQGGNAAGAGAIGASGTTGTTGSSAAADSIYRITLRMDDGTTRVVTQDQAPSFRGGDRVNMMDGAITR